MKSVVTILAIFLIRCAYLRAEPEPSMMDMSKKIIGSDSCIFGVESMSILMYNSSSTAKNISQTEEICQSIGLKKNVVILIHGFQSKGDAKIFKELAKPCVEKGYTVFAMDWSQGACTHGVPIVRLAEYPSAVNNTREIGERIANFIHLLTNKCEISLKDIIFIGHSLGAHVAGFAAKSIYNSTGEKVSRIIAADPARPMFSDNNCTERLCKTDATCVKVVHTTSSLGNPDCMGDLDLYCNNGDAMMQPGCMIDVACSHTRSVKYISKMISGCGFPGVSIKRQLKMLERKPAYPNSSTTDCIFINENILDENCSITGSYYVFVEKDPFCTQNTFNCKQ